MTSGSEVMCRKKVETPWSIYRVFTVTQFNPYPTMNGFFGPDASYRTKKGILISAICFKKINFL